MRSQRFSKARQKKNKELDVDITSLLDILVILLVFLLKSYNPTDLKLDVVKNISIPSSDSKTLGHTAITLQVSGEKEFWIETKKMGVLSQSSSDRYEKLFSILTDKKKETKEKVDRMPAEQKKLNEKKAKNINLVFDRTLPYEVIQKVMHTSALAGYTQYKFIVQGKYQ